MEWYQAQPDKSESVRAAILAYMRLQNGTTQEAVIKNVVARELVRLPDIVAAAVRDVLEAYSLAPAALDSTDGENPELAARLDAGLDNFFEGP